MLKQRLIAGTATEGDLLRAARSRRSGVIIALLDTPQAATGALDQLLGWRSNWEKKWSREYIWAEFTKREDLSEAAKATLLRAAISDNALNPVATMLLSNPSVSLTTFFGVLEEFERAGSRSGGFWSLLARLADEPRLDAAGEEFITRNAETPEAGLYRGVLLQALKRRRASPAPLKVP